MGKAKNEKKMENGYASFTRDDINTGDNRNTLAEQYFLQMLDIPKCVAKKVKKGKEAELIDDDFYPRNRQETEQMEELLQKAEEAIDDPTDKDLMGNLSEMRSIIDWSKKRHFEFAWWIIICVFIMGCYYMNEAGDEVKTRKGIESWTEQASADRLEAEKARIETSVKANPASDYWNKKWAAISTMTAEDYKQSAVKQQNRRVWVERGSGLWCFAWIILYIIAVRPKGYMITRRRTEAAVYSGMRKFLFGVAGAMFGAAGALQFTEVITTWSDGSKTRDDDGSGPLILAMKIGLVVGAVLLVIWVARIVIVIATVLGFIRNYDWVKITNKAIETGKQLTQKAE